MKKYSFFLVAAITVLASCGPAEKPADQEPVVKKATMSCSDVSPEIPQGKIINEYDAYDHHYYATYLIKGDSLFHYDYAKDKSDTSKYYEVDVVVAALKDIDTAEVYTSEYDLDLTDGTKEHQICFFVKSRKEEKLFRAWVYSCVEPEYEFRNNGAHTCNFTTKTIDIAKEAVAEIKSKVK